MDDKEIAYKMYFLDKFLKFFLRKRISDYDVNRLNEVYEYIDQSISELELYLKTGLCPSYDNIKNILNEIAKEIVYKKYGENNEFDNYNFSIKKSINNYYERKEDDYVNTI